ncbi:MAG TPA: competence/damage-inducible protein A [Bacillota bacterium]|nr:competence/damage-inducible protein A [Bacillota bacterium]
MKTELIFTGTELLLGHVLNTHGQYLGIKLSELGIEVLYHTAVGDDWDRLRGVVRQALERSELIIVTGGLGPTTDDLTVEAVADVLGIKVVLDRKTLDSLYALYRNGGRAMPESNIKQAYFPEGAVILPNTRGTAPGALVEKQGKIIVLLPGPPFELTAMFENSVIPYLNRRMSGRQVMRYKVLKLTGISESAVQDRIKDLGGRGNPCIAYVARLGEIQVRVAASAGSPEAAEKILGDLFEKVCSRLEEFAFGYDDDLLEEVLGKLLKESRLTIGVAESCTGGLIGSKLTDVPGSSEYFKGGLIAYSNEVKTKVLGVPPQTIEKYGAVSRETAIAMAEGVRKLTGSDLGLAVTGIAGPGGYTEKKPVGLVYVSLSTEEGSECLEYRFPGKRAGVRHGAANAAMNMARRYLLANKSGRKTGESGS